MALFYANAPSVPAAHLGQMVRDYLDGKGHGFNDHVPLEPDTVDLFSVGAPIQGMLPTLTEWLWTLGGPAWNARLYRLPEAWRPPERGCPAFVLVRRGLQRTGHVSSYDCDLIRGPAWWNMVPAVSVLSRVQPNRDSRNTWELKSFGDVREFNHWYARLAGGWLPWPQGGPFGARGGVDQWSGFLPGDAPPCPAGSWDVVADPYTPERYPPVPPP